MKMRRRNRTNPGNQSDLLGNKSESPRIEIRNTSEINPTNKDISNKLKNDKRINKRECARELSADVPPFDALAELLALGADPTEAKRWLAYRMERKKPMDAGALDYFLGEVRAAGLTVAQAVHECAGNKWLGFKRGYDGWWNRPQQRTPQRGNTFEHQSSAEQYAQEQAERMRPQIAAMFAAKQEKRDD